MKRFVLTVLALIFTPLSAGPALFALVKARLGLWMVRRRTGATSADQAKALDAMRQLHRDVPAEDLDWITNRITCCCALHRLDHRAQASLFRYAAELAAPHRIESRAVIAARLDRYAEQMSRARAINPETKEAADA